MDSSKKQELLAGLPETIFGVPSEIFVDHFYDVRTNKAQPGQILAKYVAWAEFVDGKEKRDIINLLKIDKAHQATQVMRKIHCCREPDCYRLLREMCEDLISGMTDEQVEKKAYPFVLEVFFYVERQYVPENDPHWVTIKLMEYDKEKNTYISKIEV
jgi:hypothetical protein